MGKFKVGISNPLKSPGDYLLAPFTAGTSLIQYNDKGLLERGVKATGDVLFGKKPKPNTDKTFSEQAREQAQRMSDAATGSGESIATQAMRESQKQSLGNALAGVRSIGGISPQLRNKLAKNQAAAIGAQTQDLENKIKLEEKAQNEALLAQHLAQMQGTQLTDQQTAMGAYNAAAQARTGLATGVGTAIMYGAKEGNKNWKTPAYNNAPAEFGGDR